MQEIRFRGAHEIDGLRPASASTSANGRTPQVDHTLIEPPTLAIAEKIGADVAGPAAIDVDREARFPHEAIGALREAGMLGALVPTELGGLGCSLDEVAQAVTALAVHCPSTAMVFAMHQIQVACVLRHGHSDHLAAFAREVATEGLLLASATTEVGVGGDTRRSICAVELHDGHFDLLKEAPVLSYGTQADAVLATARRSPDSAQNDQVLVLCRRGNFSLEETSGWDTLGFRGTCSVGFRLRASGDERDILPEPFTEISSRTILPVSHILWSSVWYGIAVAAEDKARRFVQTAARKAPGSTPPGGMRLAELNADLQAMSALVLNARRHYCAVMDDPEQTSSVAFTTAMNALKVSAAEMVVEAVHQALLICGIAGYANHGPFTLGMLLRDALGAELMVNNDRINANNAQLLLVQRNT